MENQLQKALSLSKKTGDILLVFNASGDTDPFVLMDLDAYEKIIIGKSEVRGLSEDELLDKINRDIAIWRSENNSVETNSKRNISDFETKSFVPVGDVIDERWGDDFDDSADDEFGDMFDDNDLDDKEKDNKNPWKIPSERKQAAEEIVDEDLQYLEKI
ncbi:MAG: hypothetical protein U9Q85_02695 [Patescibacteria group bacterium]|nr:hypothetical protein [Patescibacteria group bacterium]